MQPMSGIASSAKRCPARWETSLASEINTCSINASSSASPLRSPSLTSTPTGVCSMATRSVTKARRNASFTTTCSITGCAAVMAAENRVAGRGSPITTPFNTLDHRLMAHENGSSHFMSLFPAPSRSTSTTTFLPNSEQLPSNTMALNMSK